MFPVEIRTDRLSLRRATREEVSTLECYDYCREGAEDIDEVTRYVPWDPHATPKETLAFSPPARSAGTTARRPSTPSDCATPANSSA
ncbi:hypothetical protein [Halogeometricum pallidum]|uniref:hypothetical protein n=1 Tax=Halogeometricum pallidum TaxID=411361 RepID=UPI001EF9CD91|nr:hypothetical protein [Halogeometricum pallidum]